jgi:hypothetical protein
MPLQRGHQKDIGMIWCINEKELLALDLNCMERDRILMLVSCWHLQSNDCLFVI